MSVFAFLITAAGEEHGEEHIDRTHHAIWPEGYEIWFGGIASVVIFALLAWKVGPMLKKALNARTERIQAELDGAVDDEKSAEAEAARIRQAKGDIEAERARIFAEAEARAEALLAEGRVRLDREVAELNAKADADIAAAASRGSDELRSEVARLASAAAERVIGETIDEATHQRLIEDFIARVGASTPSGVRS
jgi:F-type H+-transporting ATPase subunit b